MIIIAEQPQDARPTRLFGAIHHPGLRGHSLEVASHHDGPFYLDSPTLGMSSRQRAKSDLQVEQSVEFMHAAAAGRGVPSGSAVSNSGRQREQPGEAQEPPLPTSPGTAGGGLMLLAGS